MVHYVMNKYLAKIDGNYSDIGKLGKSRHILCDLDWLHVTYTVAY